MLQKNDVLNQLHELRAEQVPVFDNDTKNEITGYSLIRMEKSKKPIRILSKKYSLYQHEDAANDVFEKLDKMMVNYEIKNLTKNVGAGKNSIQLSIGFPDISFDVDGSKTMATTEVINSVDGLVKYSNLFGFYRMVCSNGMIIGENVYKEQRKHSANFFFNLDDFDTFYEKMEQNKKFSEVIGYAQKKKVNETIKEQLMKAGFPNKMVKNMNEVYQNYAELHNEQLTDYSTLWAYFAVLTNWITHYVAKRNIQRSVILNQRLNQVMLNNI